MLDIAQCFLKAKKFNLVLRSKFNLFLVLMHEVVSVTKIKNKAPLVCLLARFTTITFRSLLDKEVKRFCYFFCLGKIKFLSISFIASAA